MFIIKNIILPFCYLPLRRDIKKEDIIIKNPKCEYSEDQIQKG